MSRIFATTLLMMALSIGQGHAAPASAVCSNDKLSNSNGFRIRMVTGRIYQAYPGSQSRLSVWLPLDRVTICRLTGTAVRITNLNRKNQTVEALRSYP